MTTPNTIIADLTAEVESLRKQRDELIKVTESLLDMDVCYRRGLAVERAVDACHLAIANAKGGS